MRLPPPPPADPHTRSTSPRTRRLRWALVLALALAVSVATVEGSLLLRGEPSGERPASADSTLESSHSSDDGVDARATATTDDLSNVIASAMASVVSIQTTGSRADVFGRTVEVEGSASGVIVGEGLIVTNEHVVDGASAVNVTFSDEEGVSATVLGVDDAHDLAVLSAETGGRPAIEIGTSSDLDLGDAAIALGYPLGLGATATAGIVSGLDREIDVSSTTSIQHMEGLLQTDAAINPGNSGGPVIDSAGRLIGISTAAAYAASAENIGFAIAIDEAVPVVESLAGTAL
jgi:S1-C subfamily serine protease